MLDSASDEYGKTAKFCHMFDKFFDCLNSHNASKGKKGKQDLETYHHVDDRRFEVILNCHADNGNTLILINY